MTKMTLRWMLERTKKEMLEVRKIREDQGGVTSDEKILLDEGRNENRIKDLVLKVKNPVNHGEDDAIRKIFGEIIDEVLEEAEGLLEGFERKEYEGFLCRLGMLEAAYTDLFGGNEDPEEEEAKRAVHTNALNAAGVQS